MHDIEELQASIDDIYDELRTLDCRLDDAEGEIEEAKDRIRAGCDECPYLCAANKAVESIKRGQLQLNAAARVLFRLIAVDRVFTEQLVSHLFVKKEHSQKEFTERVKSIQETRTGSADFYKRFYAAIRNEMAKRESEGQNGE